MIEIEGVKVQLGRDPENPMRFKITVSVASQRRLGLKASQDIDPGDASSTQNLLQLIGTAAAACAEYLDTKYGDDIDPGDASGTAIRAFGEEIRLIKGVQVMDEVKVTRLELAQHRLDNAGQDKLGRLRYKLDTAEKFTHEESEWLNGKIAELHTNQL